MRTSSFKTLGVPVQLKAGVSTKVWVNVHHGAETRHGLLMLRVEKEEMNLNFAVELMSNLFMAGMINAFTTRVQKLNMRQQISIALHLEKTKVNDKQNTDFCILIYLKWNYFSKF